MAKKRKQRKGYLRSNVVRAITFYIVSTCIFASVFASILAIWNFADPDIFWRLIATFVVIGLGSAVFAFVNGVFGSEEEEKEEQ